MTMTKKGKGWGMRIKDEDTGKYMVPCGCDGGRLLTECCNGSSGCSCRGDVVDMGACRVCNGTGFRYEDADTQANLRFIRTMAEYGMGYLGSGPRGY